MLRVARRRARAAHLEFGHSCIIFSSSSSSFLISFLHLSSSSHSLTLPYLIPCLTLDYRKIRKQPQQPLCLDQVNEREEQMMNFSSDRMIETAKLVEDIIRAEKIEGLVVVPPKELSASSSPISIESSHADDDDLSSIFMMMEDEEEKLVPSSSSEDQQEVLVINKQEEEGKADARSAHDADDDRTRPPEAIKDQAPWFDYPDYSLLPDPNPGVAITASGRIPTFPAKMLAILSREDISDICSWLPHGRSWRIWKRKEFEAKVIPAVFGHSKFSSFVRQANGWGFTRITRKGPDQHSYYHPLFLRGVPHLLKRMKRSNANKRPCPDQETEPFFDRIALERPLPEVVITRTPTKNSFQSGSSVAVLPQKEAEQRGPTSTVASSAGPSASLNLVPPPNSKLSPPPYHQEHTLNSSDGSNNFPIALQLQMTQKKDQPGYHQLNGSFTTNCSGNAPKPVPEEPTQLSPVLPPATTMNSSHQTNGSFCCHCGGRTTVTPVQFYETFPAHHSHVAAFESLEEFDPLFFMLGPPTPS